MKRSSSIQVPPSSYLKKTYIDKPRWTSYWHQINEVLSLNPTSVLEIGIGNGIVAHTLELMGVRLTTADFDKELNPNVVADVRKLPFRSNKFDVVLCAEVLEHIPYESFLPTLNEIYRLSKKGAIVTLPQHYLTYLLFTAKFIPFVKPKSLYTQINFPIKHTFNGQHYWEIGKIGYPLKRITKDIENSGFEVTTTYTLPDNPYHRYFVLKKREK